MSGARFVSQLCSVSSLPTAEHAPSSVALLQARGFGPVDVWDGSVDEALASVPDDAPGAAAINANVELLNARLFRPSTYAVVAARTR